MNGFINIIKREGMTSAFAVGIVKSRLHSNCGHMGTLDPMASGVLPIGLNKASRLFPYLLDKRKTYEAELKFGVLTDTLDITGKVTETTKVLPTPSEVEASLKNFIGEISQIPPNYSAKSIGGKRSYDLARSGKEFILPEVTVSISDIKLLNQVDEATYRISVSCKGGTYIRSLIRDIGLKNNSLATMTKLCRTSSGIFDISSGVDIEKVRDIAGNIAPYIIPADSVINFEKLFLTERQSTRLLNGLNDEYPLPFGLYRVYNGLEFWGVGEVDCNSILRMKSYVRD